FKFPKMHQAQVFASFRFPLLLRDALHSHPEFHVLPNGEPGKQTQFLEDENAVSARSLHILVIDQNIARGLAVKACNQMQESGFSAARGSNNTEKFTGANIQPDIL